MLSFRKATESDLQLYYDLATDESVRKFSFNQDKISLAEHTIWFRKMINNHKVLMLVFEENQEFIGQVRIEKKEKETIIGIAITAFARGKGYAIKLLEQASTFYFDNFSGDAIFAYIKEDNVASIKAFSKAGYYLVEHLEVMDIPSIKLVRKRNYEHSNS